MTEDARALNGYRAAPVAGPARAFALELWAHAAPPDRWPPAHRLLPTPEPSVGLERRRGRNGAVEDMRWIVRGPTHGPGRYAPRPGWELICVRLAPETAADALGVAPGDLVDAPVTALHPHLVRLLEPLERTAADAAPLDLARDIADALCAVPGARDAPATAARAFGDLARRRSSRARVSAFAAHIGVSERQLRRSFAATAALPPKIYARIRRLLDIAKSADRIRRPRWAILAAEHGYADQAHLISEFRSLAGLTPTAVHRERAAESDFYNSAA